MSLTLSLHGESYTVEIRRRDPELVCAVGERELAVAEAHDLSGQSSFFTIDGQYYQVWRACDGDTVWVHIGGRVFTVDVANPLDKSKSENATHNDICADMPGLVVELHTKAGATVALGDPIVTIESMKMQIVLHAPQAGIVDKIHHERNLTFDKGAVLVSLKPIAN